jgi:hypothetical protein
MDLYFEGRLALIDYPDVRLRTEDEDYVCVLVATWPTGKGGYWHARCPVSSEALLRGDRGQLRAACAELRKMVERWWRVHYDVQRMTGVAA